MDSFNYLCIGLSVYTMYGSSIVEFVDMYNCMVNIIYSGQWNPSIRDTFGEQCFGLCYTEVAFVERLFCTKTVHLGPGCLAVI